MKNAREDLAGNVGGYFSPEDWDKILLRARDQFLVSAKPESEAWTDVIRDFHREKYWGFVANYKKPKAGRDDESLGKRFLWYVFRSFLITKVVILYCGARYSMGDQDPIYTYLFFGAMAFMLCSYGLFLYRYAGRKEQEKS